MIELTREHGINSFKMFLAYKDVFQLSDPDLLSSFSACKTLGALAQVHAENGDIIKEVKTVESLNVTHFNNSLCEFRMPKNYSIWALLVPKDTKCVDLKKSKQKLL